MSHSLDYITTNTILFTTYFREMTTIEQNSTLPVEVIAAILFLSLSSTVLLQFIVSYYGKVLTQVLLHVKFSTILL